MDAQKMPIEPGQIVQWRGRRYFVAETFRRSVAICPIERDPIPRHRSDIPVNTGDCITLGLMSETVIRCVPFAVKKSRLTPDSTLSSPSLALTVKDQIDREAQAQAFEAAFG